MMNPYPNLFGNHITRTFVDIFPTAEEFAAEFAETPLYTAEVDANLTYFLLLAQYANSSIASIDEIQFKLKLFSTIFMYGPAWAKRLEIQKTLRSLGEDEITRGSKRINNVALNPGTAPSTDTLDELPAINQQIVDGWRKSKLEGYGTLLAFLETDITKEFLDKFKKLFITVVEPNLPLWYETEVDS